MNKEIPFDNILIDIFKVTNEKFTLDYRNIPHDMKYDILEVIEQIIRDGTRNSINSNSAYNENSLENGHFIVSLKFFKFVTETDVYKEQREVEIIRAVSFIDIEGFNSEFTDILLHNKTVSRSANPKQYTLLNFVNLIEAIYTEDLENYSAVNSILCSLVTEILKVQNSSFFLFGFVDQNDNSILESTVTLQIMNKFKNLNPDHFFDVVQDLNIDISNMNENNNLKEEFHTIDNIFSEMIFFIEKIQKKTKMFSEDFYMSIKDLSQIEKYQHLKNHLAKKNFNIEANVQLKSIFDCVLAFFNNRSKWRNLFKVRDEIIKLNSSHKETESNKNTESNNNNNLNYTLKAASFNDTDELKSVLKNLSKIVKNDNDSIFDSISENNHMNKNIEDNIKDIREDKKEDQTNNNTNTKADTTNKQRSVETTFINLILQKFLNNMTKSAKNIFFRYTEDDKCISCRKNDEVIEPINYKEAQHEYHILKSTHLKKEKDLKDNLSFNDLKRESMMLDNNNMKTTNIRSYNLTKTYENYKNQETNFKMFKSDKRLESINNPSSNNIRINKDVISDILSNTRNQFSLNRNSQSNSQSKSESIQIFKINAEINKQEAKEERNNKENSINININKSIRNEVNNSNSVNFKQNCFANSINNFNQKKPESSLHSSSIDIHLSERMSKIEEKMNGYNIKMKDSFIVNNIQNNNNLDSRVKSQNDISEFEESMIIQHKSFLSYNNN